MGLSGKYDFRGIKKLGAAGIRSALSSVPALAPFVSSRLTDLVLEFLTNWLANKGLVILNVGGNYLEGELDQKAFDREMDDAIREITAAGGADALSPQRKKEIDDAVIRSARKFIRIGRT